jgi:putative restriction endonuclease
MPKPQPGSTLWVDALRSEHRTHPLYKPAMLLSAIDLIDEDAASPQNVPFSDRLERRFDELLARAGEPNTQSMAWQPFFRLAIKPDHGDPIWSLRKGIEPSAATASPESNAALREIADSAVFRPDLASVLQTPDGRTFVVDLIYTWLEPHGERGVALMRAHDPAWPQVERALHAIRDSLKTPFKLFRDYQDVVVSDQTRRFRDRALRMEVLPQYDHACALCGLRIRWYGRIEACAAHIVPVERGGTDDVRNALSLCSTHQWSFDRGLWTVDDHGKAIVVTPPAEASTAVDVGALTALAGRKIAAPKDPRCAPHADALAWHRTNVFVWAAA